MAAALLIAAGYLAGSIPFGLLLARRFAGVDVRTGGSGNIGATNVARLAGKKLGALALVLDALKGALPALAAQQLVPAARWVAVAAGGAAIVGHVFPVWLKLRGGKGVATALGAFLVLAPLPTLAGVAAFGAVAGVSRIVALGSLAAAATAVGVAYTLMGPALVSHALAGTAVLILARHADNLRMLLGRTPER